MNRYGKKYKRVMAVVMALLLGGTSADFGTFPIHAASRGRETIVEFRNLPEKVRRQELEKGAEESAIVFPENLEVILEIGAEREGKAATRSSLGKKKASPSSAESRIVEDDEKEPDEVPLINDLKDIIQSKMRSEAWRPPFAPMTVYAAATPSTVTKDLSSAAAGKTASEQAASEGGVSDPVQREAVLENISWELDEDRSSRHQFSSENPGDVFVYIPVIPEKYAVDAEAKLPAVTVRIIDKKPEYPGFEMSRTVGGVKVTVSADEGVFPEDAVLSVTQVPIRSAEEADAAVEKERDSGKTVAVSYTFDIRVLDKDGNELQPGEEGKVRVSFAMAETADRNLETDVYHIREDERSGDLTAEKLESEVDERTETVTAETDGFSLYTVEFTYNSLQYVMTGGTEVPLSVILEAVGLQGETNAVEVSDGTLFSAELKDGEWVILSHAPFSSKEWLKVNINSIVYEIVVTDATTVGTWAELRTALTSSGEKTLGSNITISQAEIDSSAYLFVSNGVTVTLDLNGKTLTGGGTNATITVSSGGTLTIKDSSSAKNGKITGGDRAGNGGGIEVESNGKFTLQSGTISGNTANYGGGVHVYGGTFTMTGGTISANSSSYGGGVDISASSSYNGTFTMSGGTISDNTPSAAGGGVRVGSNCTFTMSGGTISGNRAGNNGGGVLLANGAEFNMSAGNITDNTAGSNGNGGGVYVGGSESVFTMSGGTISGNSVPGSAAWGGGVCNLGTFTMSGGSIINNSCEGRGGGLYASGTNYLQGNIKISGNKNGSQNSNVYTMKRLIITGALTNTTPIGITTNTAPEYPSSAHADGLVVIFTSGLNGKGDASKFTPDEDMHAVIIYSDSTYTNEAAMSLKYTVTVTPVTNSHMTKTSGANPQTVTMENAIANIVYTADTGYHFPTNYASLGTTNGLTVTRTSDTKITISGTPRYGDSAVNLSLAAASLISATAPTITGPSAVSMTYGDTGKTVSVTATAASGHTITGYQWYHNTTNSNTGGTAVSGATSASYSIPQKTTAGTHYYYCVVSTKRTDNGQTTTKASSAAEVTVAKKTVTLTWGTTTFTYNGNTQTPTATAGGVASGDTCTVTVTGGQKNAGTYTATANGLTGTGSANYQLPGAKTTSFTINKKTVTLTWGTTTFIYNGNIQTPTATAGGVASGDTCTVTVTGGQKNAGTYTATANGLTGTGSTNYQLPGTKTTSFTINKKAVTVSGITASDKVYNGNTTAALVTSGAVFSGKLSADTLTVSATGTFNNKNAGTGKTVTISGLTLGGSSAGNYQLAASGNQASTTASITPKAVTLTWENTSFTYDGNTHIPTALAAGLLDGDTCSVTVEGAASNPGIHTATASALSNSNYQLPAEVTQSFTIGTRTVTVSGITAENKVYDGTTAAALNYSGVTFEGLVSGDTLTVTATGTFNDKNAGTGKSVSLSGLTLGGADAGSYVLGESGNQTETTADITPKEVGLAWGETSFIYDGAEHLPEATATGLVDGDSCTVTVSGSATAPGTHTATAESLSNSNYQLPATKTQSFTIGTRTVTVSGITAESRVYDGTTAATLDYSGVTFDGLVSGDTLTVTAAGTFSDKNAGTGKTVSISGLTLGGADAGSYVLGESGNQTETTADITPKEVGLAWGETSFIYDGAEHLPEATATGLVDGDSCTVTVSGSATAPGTHTATAESLSNSNYQLPAEVTQSFTIGTRTVTVSGITAENKVYDGSTAAVLNYSGVTFDGLVSGDTLTVTAAGTFSDKNAGTGKTVSISGLTLGGADAGSYMLADTGNQTETTADITPKEVGLTWGENAFTYDGAEHVPEVTATGLVDGDSCTVTVGGAASAPGSHTATAESLSNSNYQLPAEVTQSFTIGTRTVTVSGITAENKVYDGTSDAVLDYSGAAFEGIIPGDALTVTAAGSFDSADTAYGKTVSISGLTLGGADAGSYVLADTGNQTETTADITPKEVVLTWGENAFTYDGAEHVPEVTATGLVDGDSCTVTVGGAASAPGSHMATAESLSNSNYQLPAEVTQSFTIGTRTVTVSGITAENRDYDGTTAVKLNLDNVVIAGLVDGDTVTVTASGSFADAAPGTGKTVYITGLALGGANADRYLLAASGNQETTTADIIEKTSPAPAPTPEPAPAPAPAAGAGNRWHDRTRKSGGRWNQENMNWTYRLSDGRSATGWNLLSYNGRDDWYFFGSDGYMQTGWVVWNGFRYYLNPVSDGRKGAMYTGWHLIDGIWYYFEAVPGSNLGHLYVNTITPDGYYVDENGAWIPGR